MPLQKGSARKIAIIEAVLSLLFRRKSMTQVTITTLLNFEVESAWRHRWKTGFSLMHFPAAHFNLWLVERGMVTVQSGERHWQVTAGEAFMAPVHYPRDITTEGVALLSIGFRSPSFNQADFFAELPLPAKWRPQQADARLLKTWITQIIARRSRHTPHDQLVCQGLGTAVMGVCLPYLGNASSEQLLSSAMPPWLIDILRKMREDPAVSVTQLQQLAGFSPAQFRKNFQQWTHASPQQYLKAQRLETAHFLLRSTDLSLAAIAQRVGIDSASYLSKAFKTRYGCSPSQFRVLRRHPQI